MSLVIFHIHLFLIYLCLFCFIIFSLSFTFSFWGKCFPLFPLWYLKATYFKSLLFKLFYYFSFYSNRIYLMILAVVFLGIVFLDASWTFGLPALQMLVLFLFSLLFVDSPHTVQWFWQLLSPESRTSLSQRGHWREGGSVLWAGWLVSSSFLSWGCLLSLGLWGCRNPTVKQQSRSRNSELYFRGGIHISL